MAKKRKDNIDSFRGMFKGIPDQTQEQNSIENLEEGKYMSGTTRSKGRPKEERETKKRISLAVMPSLYDNVGKIAYIDRVSISELVSNLLDEYVKSNQSKIDEYDKMKKN